MPHQCVKCSVIYPDAAPQMISGCACGSTAFLYLRSSQEKKAAERDETFVDSVVYKEEEGKYTIDLEESFKKCKKH